MKRLDLKTGMVRAECETETALYPLCYDSNTLGIDHVGHGFLGAQGKTVEFLPVCNLCPLPTSYNLSFFILDAAFYDAIGYVIVLIYTRRVLKQKGSSREPK